MDYPKIECLQKNKGFFLRRNLVNMKEKLIGLVEKSLKEPQSSLFVGILFGQERLFSKDFEKNIRIAGVSHIVAASGYNVTILLIVLNSIFKFLPKKVRIILSIAIIWCFCLLSGVSPSIVRACIMASISLMGILLGRKNSIHITFLLCIFVFVVFKPKILLDVGFQLSVFATCGLIYLLPSITKSLKITGEGFLKDTVLTTISCTLTTLPISILTFKTFSLWSVLANTLILPVVESTMLFGTLAMIFSSRFLYLVVHLQLKYVETVVNLIGNSEFGYWDVQSGKWFVITLIIFLLLFCIYFYPVDDESTNYYLKIYS